MLPKHRSIFFPLLNELLLIGPSGLFLLVLHFALHSGHSRFGVSIVLGVDLLSRLFEHPVILIVIIVTSFVHEILEYFSHVVVVWSLLELQISAIIQVSVELLWKTSS